LTAVITSKGRDFVVSASCPMPLFDKVIADYVVPVTSGPRGYVDRHGISREI
jgi:hypothetical protein